MIPGITCSPHLRKYFTETIRRVTFYYRLHFCYHRIIFTGIGLIVIHSTTYSDSITGFAYTQPIFLFRIIDQLTFFGWPQSFFSMTSFNASCCKLKSAYILFNLRFSSASSLSFLTSEAVMPMIDIYRTSSAPSVAAGLKTSLTFDGDWEGR